MNCAICGSELVTADDWLALSDDARTAARIAGKRRMGARGLCSPDYEHVRVYEPDRLADYPTEHYTIGELLEEAEHLFADGVNPPEVARRLGLKLNSLADTYRRARAKGLTTRYVPWRWAERRAA